jgi:hypothetical protein
MTFDDLYLRKTLEGQLDVLTVMELGGNPAHDRLDSQI